MELGMGLGMRQTLRQEPRIILRQIVDFRLAQEQIQEMFEEYKGRHVPLIALLQKVPQRQHGTLVYAVAGGWATEVLSRKKREHGNINVVLMDEKQHVLNSDSCLDYLFLQYGNGLKKNQVVTRSWTNRPVHVAGPEFMIATKVAPHSGKLPREKDLCDVVYIMESQPELDPNKLRTAFGNYPSLTNRGEYVRQLMMMHDVRKGNGNRIKQRYALDILSRTIANNIAENETRRKNYANDAVQN